MRSRRALLYVPGDEMHKIQKAIGLGVDSICLDIEDGVALNHKEQARGTIAEALGALDFGRSERLVRINPVGSGMEAEDLRIAINAHPDGIVIPKVREAGQVQWISDRVGELERATGRPDGDVILIALIETARAIVNLGEIVRASPRLQALIFGAEDLAGDIGAVRTRAGWEIFYARSAVVTHAAAYGLQAIDMVFLDFKDAEGLRAEAIQAAQMGYTGKQVIHPAQVGPTQEAFTPGAEEIAYATQVVEAAVRHQQDGRGAFALDGKMIDAPVVKIAEWVLQRARAAGKI